MDLGILFRTSSLFVIYRLNVLFRGSSRPVPESYYICYVSIHVGRTSCSGLEYSIMFASSPNGKLIFQLICPVDLCRGSSLVRGLNFYSK